MKGFKKLNPMSDYGKLSGDTFADRIIISFEIFSETSPTSGESLILYYLDSENWYNASTSLRWRYMQSELQTVHSIFFHTLQSLPLFPYPTNNIKRPYTPLKTSSLIARTFIWGSTFSYTIFLFMFPPFFFFFSFLQFSFCSSNF